MTHRHGAPQAALTTALLALFALGAVASTGSTIGSASAAGSEASGTTVGAIDGLSSTDVWAVGREGAATAVWHWDGTAWTHPKSPSPGSDYNNLFGVSEVSADDVWAVGDTGNQDGRGSTLIEHFDGTKWRRVASPNRSSFAGLSAVSAASAHDVWAVGFSADPRGSIVEHWDGSSWTLSPATKGALLSTEANASGDVWAVDQSQREVTHWDGSSWRAGTGFVLPIAVGGSATDDVWAVGADDPKADTSYAAHFDGATWTPRPVATVRGHRQWLTGVSADAPTDAWAIGETFFGLIGHGYIEHWDGHAWSVAKKPDQLGTYSAVLGLGSDDAWVAGDIQDQGRGVDVEHWTGTTWEKYVLR